MDTQIMGNQNNLHPLHLQDLRKSGVSDQTVIEAGIVTVPPGDINREVGYSDPSIRSAYRIPYPGLDGYSRLKLFYHDGQGQGKPRYIQKKGSQNHLYIPHGATDTLQNTSIPLYIAEGEKKVLKAWQEGFPCVAMGGLHSWSKGDEEKTLIEDFDLIALDGRTVYLVPDNDWLAPNDQGERKNLRQAVLGLAYRLIDRGAKVSVVKLPAGPDKGVDDFLCSHTAEEFKALPAEKIRKLTIEEAISAITGDTPFEDTRELIKRMSAVTSETEQEAYIRKLSKKTGISRRRLLKDIQRHVPAEPEETGECVIAHPAYEVNNMFSSVGFKEKVVVEGRIREKPLFIISHDGSFSLTREPLFILGNVKIVFEVEGRILKDLREKWDKGMVEAFLKHPETPKGVYREIKETLKAYIEFQREGHYGLVAAWIIATYFARCFHAVCFLFFYGKKQSGKSRVLDFLERLSFNSVKVKGVSTASLADSVDGVRGTFLVDQAELLSSLKYQELLGMLTDSYTIGGGKRRVVDFKNKERRLREFETYGFKGFASTRDIDSDLKDRCILVPMVRAEKEYPYPEAHLPIWKELRDKLYRLSLTRWPDVRQLYPGAGMRVKQRVRELWRPLETVLTLEAVPPSEVQTILDVFLEAMEETQAGLNETENELFRALFRLLDATPTRTMTAEEIRKEMTGVETGEGRKFKSERALETWIGTKVSRLYLYSEKLRKDEKGKRPYSFTREQVEKIYARYTTGAGGAVVPGPLINEDLQTGTSKEEEPRGSGNRSDAAHQGPPRHLPEPPQNEVPSHEPLIDEDSGTTAPPEPICTEHDSFENEEPVRVKGDLF